MGTTPAGRVLAFTACGAAVSLAALTLTACDGGTQPPPSSSESLTESPAPTNSTTPGVTSTATASLDPTWGAYGDREDACTAVASNVVSLSLLPVSMTFGGTVEEVQRVEDDVEAMKDSAPPDLTADYAWVQLLVDNFGEQLAARDARASASASAASAASEAGSSPASESGGSSEEPEEVQPFDATALNRALTPIRAWLTDHCEGATSG